MTSLKLQILMHFLEECFPPTLAEEWDQVGLHFGSRNQTVKRVMTALDARPDTIEEAIDKNIDTLIVHHPPLFSPIERFDYDLYPNQMYRRIIQHDINIYAMHTNVDRAKGGMNDWLAEQLDLENIKPIENTFQEHSLSIPRVGQLKVALNQKELIRHIKQALNLEHLLLIEENEKPQYQTIMISGGAGSSFLEDALVVKPDVFITGDITFHKAQEFYEQGITLIDAGHYIEHIFTEKVAQLLKKWQQENNFDIEIIASTASTNPYRII